MRYPCAKCDKEIEKQQGYEHQGKLFCEDCYMDVLSPPKACDPWAVHSAQTFLKGKDKLATLTPLQLRLVNYLKQKGEATLEELIEESQFNGGGIKKRVCRAEAYGNPEGNKKGRQDFLSFVLRERDLTDFASIDI